jgi:hypothetical protein
MFARLHLIRRVQARPLALVLGCCAAASLPALKPHEAGATPIHDPALEPYVENLAGTGGAEVYDRTERSSSQRFQAALRPSARSGGASFLKGYADPSFTTDDASLRSYLFDQAALAEVNIVRINISWSTVAPTPPANPTQPADPAYRWANVDAAVRAAADRGQRILLSIFEAPAWAEGPNRPQPSDESPSGSWKPNPAAFGDFAQAVATRYSGQFPAAGAAALPRAGYLTAWNEPNLTDYVTPQSVRGKLFAPDHYRKMVNAFSDGVARSANPTAEVIAGATSPYGDAVGGRRTRPLQFLRDFLCLKENLKAQKACPGGKADFDILSHHPITISGGPGRSAIHPDDAAMPDFKHVVRTLRAAEKRNAVKGNRHPAWATEFWWETNPPDPAHGVPLQKHARWVQESLYSLWKQGASAAIWFLILDEDPGDDGSGGLQSGHFFFDRTQKPAFQAFRFPFVADRISRRKVNVWTIAPISGELAIQRKRGGDFKTIDSVAVPDGKPKQTKIKLKGEAEVRGVLGGQQTLASKVQ